MVKRCGWVKENNPIYVAYHDNEWGKPLHDERALFELLCLESYQAGLSWETVLKKRAAFQAAFYDYHFEQVANMTEADIAVLLENPAIIRHRAKLAATVANAKAFLEVQKEFGSFDHYIWSWVDFKPVTHTVSTYQTLPSKTPLSEKIAKDLKKRGFKFVGPVCLYSFLQAAGLVNDHEEDCFFKNQSDIFVN